MLWTEDPYLLMNRDYIFELWPTESMDHAQKINAMTRFIILLSLLGFMITKTYKFIAVGILAIFGVLYFQKEGFTVRDFTGKVATVDKGPFTQPTIRNPLMNVLLPEINGNPNRPQAQPYSAPVEKNITDKVKEGILKKDIDPRIFRGVANEMDLDFSMRQFYTNPSTTVPNKQGEFAEFCYGDMVSAKEGNELALARNLPRIGSIPG